MAGQEFYYAGHLAWFFSAPLLEQPRRCFGLANSCYRVAETRLGATPSHLESTPSDDRVNERSCQTTLAIGERVAYFDVLTHLRRAVGSKAVSGESSGGLLLFGTCLLRMIVYIDGFNLYYRALKLPHTAQIERINYYTAHVSGRTDPGAPKRQHAYLRAIGTLPAVNIHYGNFLVSQKWAGLVQPPTFRPGVTLPPGPSPDVARVWKTEEKGSDVNLGVHLVRDAFTAAFDQAAVLTNDTDLVEPIRIVTQELGLRVTLLSPGAKPAGSLAAVATSIRHIQPYIGPCQLPDLVTLPGKNPISKPQGW